jgi:hypothetical protein
MFKQLVTETYIYLGVLIHKYYPHIQEDINYPINQSTVSRRYSGSLSSLPPPPPPPPPFPPSVFFCEVVVVLMSWLLPGIIISPSWLLNSPWFVLNAFDTGETDR